MFSKISYYFQKLFYVLSFFCITLSLDINTAYAANNDFEFEGDNQLGIVIEKSNETIARSNDNEVPDLGDDQTFPFIPGFGKNSGKD
tara:strand:- start:320 stop:580 length:261 start_codon:yes stop_codon:yes gene_type:complete